MRILFFVIVLLIYGSANYYVGLRSYRIFLNYFPKINAVVFWIFFILIVLSYVLAALLRKQLPGLLDTALSYIGGYWLAAFMYLLILLLVNDFVFFVVRKAKGIPSGMRLTSIYPLVCIGLIIIVAGVMVYGTIHADSLKVASYNINVDKSGGSLKKLNVVMVSDIHIGQIVGQKRVEGLVGSVNALKPDVVLLAGDIIDDDVEPYIREDIKDVFKNLKSTYGTYAVLGNHEYISGAPDKLVSLYEESGIHVLRDHSVNIDDSFYIVGRDDISGQRSRKVQRKDLPELLQSVDMTKPVILMDHQPGNLTETANQKIDLQLSGHTHGGQFFPNNLITRSMYKLDWGYLKLGSFNVIVSSGFGTWGPPIRIGTDSEIVDVHMNFK